MAHLLRCSRLLLYIGAQERRRCAATARHRVAHKKKSVGGRRRGGWGRKRRKEDENTCRCGDTLGAGAFPVFYSPLNAWSTTSVARRARRATKCTNLTKKGTPVSDFQRIIVDDYMCDSPRGRCSRSKDIGRRLMQLANISTFSMLSRGYSRKAFIFATLSAKQDLPGELLENQ